MCLWFGEEKFEEKSPHFKHKGPFRWKELDVKAFKRGSSFPALEPMMEVPTPPPSWLLANIIWLVFCVNHKSFSPRQWHRMPSHVVTMQKKNRLCHTVTERLNMLRFRGTLILLCTDHWIVCSNILLDLRITLVWTQLKQQLNFDNSIAAFRW